MLASLESPTIEYWTGGHRVDLWRCPGDSRVQKATNALSESITAAFSCVTDIISLILLNCFGISCVNEHNGTERKKKSLYKLSRDCSFLWALVHFLKKRRACLAVTFWLGHTFWICHAKNPMWNYTCTSTGDKPRVAKAYHFNCCCFHINQVRQLL